VVRCVRRRAGRGLLLEADSPAVRAPWLAACRPVGWWGAEQPARERLLPVRGGAATASTSVAWPTSTAVAANRVSQERSTAEIAVTCSWQERSPKAVIASAGRLHGTSNSTGAYMIMQADGNLVLLRQQRRGNPRCCRPEFDSSDGFWLALDS
jgi:hypothetical protein